ncbi:uncharacterized protein LOC127867603 isoform X2 [Dreissena polymorpha]|uniref:uncharacterized protein LOC127867603 isoform X2 n=1 Tax=Dreissena polymorpha TaxID=45954 RepID=UPI0022655AF1|nr:uncharacterized protein LOC127867603 isoform X2 [Dreissena polymorpha]
MTADTDHVLAFLRRSTIRIDVIRLSITSGARYRRQSSIDFYQLFANVSGGSVITTDKDNIGSAVNVITQSLQTNRVNLMRLSYFAAAGQTFMAFVDDTITQLIIRVQVEKGHPLIIAQMPSGSTSSSRPTIIGSVSAGSVLSLLVINITQASDYGFWKIVKLDSFIWDVTIQATSPVDFTHKFVEPVSGCFGEYEIKGRPISEVLQNVGGRRGLSVFIANITIPYEPFMVAIQGQDNSRHTFRRLDPNLITPVTLRLFIPPLTGVTLSANETLDIPFTVQNAGAVDQDIDVRIEDDQDFAVEPKIHSFDIKAGMNETEHFTIEGGPKGGVTTTVTINAKPFVLGSTSFQSGQFHISRFTVMEHTTTTTQSTTTSMSATTTLTSTSSSNLSTASRLTLSSLLTRSTEVTTSKNPMASTFTAGVTQSPTGIPNSSSGTQSASSASQSQALSGTPKSGDTQSSSGTSTVSSLPQLTQPPVGTPQYDSTHSSPGASTVSALPQTGATQASQATAATIGRWYGRRSSDRCVMTLVETCFPDL